MYIVRGASVRRAAVINNDDRLVPVPVWKMYRETIDALNGNIRTLAGGGLRAVVEASGGTATSSRTTTSRTPRTAS